MCTNLERTGPVMIKVLTAPPRSYEELKGQTLLKNRRTEM
jgi:hypothetical protein